MTRFSKTGAALCLVSLVGCGQTRSAAAVSGLANAVQYTFDSLFAALTSSSPAAVAGRAESVAEAKKMSAMSFHSYYDYLTETTPSGSVVVGNLSFPDLHQQLINDRQAYQNLDEKFATVGDYNASIADAPVKAITSVAELEAGIKAMHDVLYEKPPTSLGLAQSSGCYKGGWFGSQDCQNLGPQYCSSFGLFRMFQSGCGDWTTVCGSASNCGGDSSGGQGNSNSYRRSSGNNNNNGWNSGDNSNNNGGSGDNSNNNNNGGSGDNSNNGGSGSGSTSYAPCTSQNGQGYGAHWTPGGSSSSVVLSKQDDQYKTVCQVK